jgi:hypothetical protein
MFINRNNYENFFLLYADGELSVDECKMVNEFIDENEDLRIELTLLQSAVLPVEEMALIDKSFLYKEIVFDKDLQEKLMLQIDNELTKDESFALHSIIATDTNAKKEYDLLQRIKLDSSEKIVFQEKHLLYKKSDNKVVPIRWARWAAAAALIGFVLFAGIKITGNKFDKKNEANDVVVSPNIPNVINDSISIDNKQIVATPKLDAVVNKTDEPATDLAVKNIVKQNNSIKDKVNTNSNTDENNSTQPKRTTREVNVEEKSLAKTVDNFMPEQKFTQDMKVAELTAKLVTPEATKKSIGDENMTPLENTYSQGVASADNEVNDTKILYMDEDDVKRTKAGGFFRKIKRFVQRTAKIKTGNTLQIAGFEIASK